MKTSFSIPDWLRPIATRLYLPARRARRTMKQVSDFGLSFAGLQGEISDAIMERKSVSFVRPGGTESEGLRTFLARLRETPERRQSYSRFFLEHVTPFSGVGYRDVSDLDYFCYQYLKSVLGADFMGFGLFAPGALPLAEIRVRLGLPVFFYEFMEPLRALDAGLEPWTTALAGKRVLVVHPFQKTIANQFARRGEISGVRDLLPEFKLVLVRPPISLGSSCNDGWRDNFTKLVNEVLKKDFEIAIIGAGGYGAPLANELARHGKTAIHTAGATQLIFGIRGVRWDKDPTTAKYFDSTWVRPDRSDLTPEMRRIDGGSYH